MSIVLTLSEKKVLEKIDFVESCRNLYNKHGDRDNKFESYENAEVLEIIKSFGYEKARYYKRENFFKVEKEIILSPYHEVSFNICLKYGLCEFIWGGQPWGRIVQLLSYPCGAKEDGYWECMKCTECGAAAANLDGDAGKIGYPDFRSYDELREILGVAFEMYEDYKRELLAIEKENLS
jgi:hypothetical protein